MALGVEVVVDGGVDGQKPQKDMNAAAEAMRKVGVGGTVKNMGGTKRRSVCPPKPSITTLARDARGGPLCGRLRAGVLGPAPAALLRGRREPRFAERRFPPLTRLLAGFLDSDALHRHVTRVQNEFRPAPL